MENSRKIILPNNQEFEINENECDGLTAKKVIEKVCQEYYNIDESYYGLFSLYIVCQWQNDENDIEKISLLLNSSHELKEVEKKIKKILKVDNEENLEIKFEFGRNFCYSIEEEKEIDDENVLKVLYLLAKDNVLNKLYPLDLDKIEIAKNIECLIEKENQNSSSQDIIKKYNTLKHSDSLRKKSKIKLQKITKRKTSNPSTDSSQSTLSLKDLYKKYLEICYELECYGSIFFYGQMERSIKEAIMHGNIYDKKVAIAINAKGVHLVHQECPKILFSQPFKNLNYETKYPFNEKDHSCLLIGNEDNKFKRKRVFTRQASFIDKTLSTFIKNHPRTSVQ